MIAFKNINPQLLQTFAIGSLLLVGGKYFGYVDIDWTEIFIVLSLILSLDFIFKYAATGKKAFPFSAVNSGIGICLFLRTANPWLYAFAAFMTIFSKHFVRFRGKHFLNPSYSAILLTIALFPYVAFTNPLQWGSDWKVLTAISVLGSIVMWRVGFMDAVIAFFVSFFVWLNLFTTYSWEDLLILYLTGSFFIQMFFGFTDPATIPAKRIYRILFVTQISLLFFIFRLFINENYSFFAAYFFVQCMEVVFMYCEEKGVRNLVQGLFIGFCFLLLAGLSFQHSVKYNGVWPEVLTNRCTQLFCKPFSMKFDELFGDVFDQRTLP